ncbi:hypothetical protein FB004_1253 [Sinorhizobium medicae]|nr:hypothetical protein FB004_1253 [Sinorhizobium medicae]TWA15328.1 hypothetical protein FB006_12932 [Sinorhizobium medicae]TWA25751.1 hypothetical protein FB007_13431 [Sinorhizobium medicae]TWA36040.1 hypothetical protein FB005_1283 [Sinorhizobium medicae]TWA45847.1 hypothetical protein FB008_12831 [Sinorhizobium medicae]
MLMLGSAPLQRDDHLQQKLNESALRIGIQSAKRIFRA